MTDEKNDFLQMPPVRIQPVLARPGTPSIDPDALRRQLPPGAELAPPIAIRNAEHWRAAIAGIDADAIALLSNPCYPTEIWNEEPEPLRRRGLPIVFWPLIDADEPDFWKWSCTDMLRSLGVTVELPENRESARAWVRALALRKFFRTAKMGVFGRQNFPWNAHAAFDRIASSLGLGIEVIPCAEVEDPIPDIAPDAVEHVIRTRLTDCVLNGVRPDELRTAAAYYLAIRETLIRKRCFAFGVNCFGDLIPRGSRTVPCLAQQLLRGEGFTASCDGDFCAMATLAVMERMTMRPAMMSNLYPLTYRGALAGHFGDPLGCGTRWADRPIENLARLAHCGYVGIVPPGMTPSGRVRLSDWGGTYEIKRDGRGCGIDGELVSGEPITVAELKFDGKTLLLARGSVLETTRHTGMPHCESSALIEIRNLPGLIRVISREHAAIGYGDWLPELRIAAGVLGLTAVTVE